LRESFLAADFLVALRGRAAVNAGFLFLPLVLFNFRGFSVVLATASLNALGAVETISFSASTVALAASITNSCATFATSRFAFDASPSAFRVELSPASPSRIIASVREPCPRERHTQIRTGSIPVIKKTCAELDCSPESVNRFKKIDRRSVQNARLLHRAFEIGRRGKVLSLLSVLSIEDDNNLAMCPACGLRTRQAAHVPALDSRRAARQRRLPASTEEVVPDVVIAPVVGFDRACYRLGYGGGFFD
jgi:5-formyltetrahydrofolate cyclo-ligase family protein